MFEVVDRRALELDAVTREPAQPVKPAGDSGPREAWESGVKDTVIAYPGEVTRIRVQFTETNWFEALAGAGLPDDVVTEVEDAFGAVPSPDRIACRSSDLLALL